MFVTNASSLGGRDKLPHTHDWHKLARGSLGHGVGKDR